MAQCSTLFFAGGSEYDRCSGLALEGTPFCAECGPKVTFCATPVVRVEVQGCRRSGTVFGRDDKGLIAAMLRETRCSGYTLEIGNGRYIALHTAQDAERIVTWLRANGAIEDTGDES